jgi:hypothetical protein
MGSDTRAKHQQQHFEKEGHMRQARYRFFLLPLFFVLACVGLYAQANSEVTGIVTDQTGAVVAGANITLTDPATGATHSTVSSGSGLYDIAGLNPANYNLKVTAKGFEAYVQSGVVVNVSGTFRVDVKLTIGKESQTVTVEADALQVQADSNVVSTLITSNDIDHLATENRNVVALAALGLGASNTLGANNSVDSVGASFAISFNGLSQAHNIYLIDGGESYDRGSGGKMAIMPSQDAIAEFQTLASNYPADYGVSSGGTISMSIKSGASKFHGTLWEENRTTDYNASQTAAAGGGVPETHFNIYGGNVSGPVFIPHVYNSSKQKTFFFWNEEWRKVIAAAATTTGKTLNPLDIPTSATSNLTYVAPVFAPSNALVIPTISPLSPLYAKLNGNCGGAIPSSSCTAEIANPGAPMPVVPGNMIDPNGYLYLKSGIIPTPNGTGSDAGYNIASTPTPLDVRDDIVRIDHNFNDKWRLMGHYIHDTVSASAPGALDGWAGHSYSTIDSVFTNPAYAAVINLTGSISPNLLLEANLYYDGNKINIGLNPIATRPSAYDTNFTPVTSAFPLGRAVFPGASWGTPYGTQEDTNTAPYSNASEDYMPTVALSYTTGRHALKFGFAYNRYVKNQQIGGDTQGNYTFNNYTDDGIMDMLMGLSGNYTQQQAAPRLHFFADTPSVFALDNWHATPRLSLQLGIRYDAYPHAMERQNQLSYFNPADYAADVNMAPGGAAWNCATCGSGTTISPTTNGVATYIGIKPTTAGNPLGAPFYMNGMDIAGQNGVPRGLVKNDFTTIEPRLGFSDDLFGNGKTILRGGAGIFYERVQLNDVLDIANAPVNNSLSLNNADMSTPGNNWSTGAVVSAANLPVFVNGGTSIDPTYKAPGVAMYSLGVQREIVPSVIWVVQYVGNVTWHQSAQRNINNFPTSTIDPVREADGTHASNYLGQQLSEYRTYPGYAAIGQEQNDTNGGYNGLQTGLRIQNRWGLSGEVDYTYSHEIDIQSVDLNSSGPGGLSNPWNTRYDRGSGVLDRRNIFSANYVYKLPIFTKSQGLVKAIAGGWQLAGTVVDESGVPSVITMSTANDLIGLGGGYTNRPSLTGKMSYPHTRSEWFNNTSSGGACVSGALWCVPTAGYAGGANLGFGNAGKDAVVGPGLVNFTTSLYKVFQFTDRVSFRLNVESFNTFNHAEYDGVSTGYSPASIGNFGAETSGGSVQPRNLQLGGRLVF